MTDILDLDGWTVIDKRRVGAEYEIEAEYTVQPDACLKCGVIGNLYRHGPTNGGGSAYVFRAICTLCQID